MIPARNSRLLRLRPGPAIRGGSRAARARLSLARSLRLMHVSSALSITGYLLPAPGARAQERPSPGGRRQAPLRATQARTSFFPGTRCLPLAAHAVLSARDGIG